MAGRASEEKLPRLLVSRAFPANPESVTRARKLAATQAQETIPTRAYDFELLVDELMANAIQHGARGSGEVWLHLEAADGYLRASVTDGGDGFTKTPADPTSELFERGRGLQLVHALADRWDVIGVRLTRVWFEIGV